VSITLRLPTVLKTAVGADRIRVSGRTVGEALDAACDAYPNLRHHILQESGELRPHVLCLVNGENLLRDGFADRALADGDEILIHQAISGG
jgi:molybdopterin converting factor small subunit